MKFLFEGRAAILCTGIMLVSASCSPDRVVGHAALPSDLADPKTAQTPAGARASYRTVLVDFRAVIGEGDSSYVANAGRITDELRSREVGGPLFAPADDADNRTLPEAVQSIFPYRGLYRAIQHLRGAANQSRGLLTDYLPEGNQPLIGHVIAVTAYAELLLAEGFCSGVPLSTLNYKGDYTYQGASTTTAVLDHAIALFDTAATFAADSARILNLARIGRARALLMKGSFSEAVQAVASVPNEFSYAVRYSPANGVMGLNIDPNQNYQGWPSILSAGDNEGGTGLPFVSANDPRLPQYLAINNLHDIPMLMPVLPLEHSIVVASGVEAQLIRAEGALRANDPAWLAILNQLRTTCITAASCTTPAPAGTGGVTGLSPLEDPGVGTLPPGKSANDVRVDLLFRERAYWLYLTGHRQGDLRRLIRFYDRLSETVYPTGPYQGNVPVYGRDVTLPVPQDERNYNPLFHGCINRSA